MTTRLENKLLKVAILTGGNGGSKICRTLNIATSGDTLLRLIKNAPISPIETPTAVGIDDWAYKKRLCYGSVVVDLEKNRIIDVLRDREEKTVTEWMQRYPGIKVVSRDRYINFANAVSKALPHAISVADRWHLIKNLGDSIQKVLEREQSALKQRSRITEQISTSKLVASPEKVTKQSTSLSRIAAKMQEVKEMHKNGMSVNRIAKTLKKHKLTVAKYLKLDEPQPKRYPEKNSMVIPFEDFIKGTVTARPDISIKELYAELRKIGYAARRTAAYTQLRQYVNQKISGEKMIDPSLKARMIWRPSSVSLSFYKKDEDLHRSERELLEYLKTESVDLQTTYDYSQGFRNAVEMKDASLLEAWVDQVMSGPIKELKSFAKGLLTDFQAVKNAISTSWSNGPVEGHVNKLKTIKRQMYGRAGFELLRRRLVLQPT